MKTTTTSQAIKNSKKAKGWETLLAVVLWLAIWFVASHKIDFAIILPTPLSVLKEIVSLAQTSSFWRSIGFTLSRIVAGFLLAFVSGNGLAVLAYRFRSVSVFLHPMMATIKAAPVASYIILCLFFMSVQILPSFIAFLMALPVMYENILQGLENTDKELLEMATVFKVPKGKKVTYIYFSELLPFLISASSLSLGLSWKAGVAAEVIAMPLGSIGEKLYQAKVLVDMPTAIAWTAVVVVISFVLEKLLLFLLNTLARKVEQ